MNLYEYKIIHSTDVESEGLFKGRSRQALENHLNKLGQQGWEIINVDFSELEANKSFSAIAKRIIGS